MPGHLLASAGNVTKRKENLWCRPALPKMRRLYLALGLPRFQVPMLQGAVTEPLAIRAGSRCSHPGRSKQIAPPAYCLHGRRHHLCGRPCSRRDNNHRRVRILRVVLQAGKISLYYVHVDTTCQITTPATFRLLMRSCGNVQIAHSRHATLTSRHIIRQRLREFHTALNAPENPGSMFN